MGRILAARDRRLRWRVAFKELRASGYNANQILSVSTELIDLVTQDLKGDESVPVAGEAPRDWRAAL